MNNKFFAAVIIAALAAPFATGCPKKSPPAPAPAPQDAGHKIVPETPKVDLPEDTADIAAARINAELLQAPGAPGNSDPMILIPSALLMLQRLHAGTGTDSATVERLAKAALAKAGNSAAAVRTARAAAATLNNPDFAKAATGDPASPSDTDSLAELLDEYELTGNNKLLAEAEKAADAIIPGNAAPHAAALAICLNRLYFYTGNPAYRKTAESILKPLAANIKTAPLGDAVEIAYAVELVRGFPLEIVVLGSKSHPQFKKLLEAANNFYEPRKIILAIDPSDPTDNKRLNSLPYSPRPEPALFACVETACAMPLSDPAKVEQRMKLFTDKFLNKKPGNEKGRL